MSAKYLRVSLCLGIGRLHTAIVARNAASSLSLHKTLFLITVVFVSVASSCARKKKESEERKIVLTI
jgi:hypothetical protein